MHKSEKFEESLDVKMRIEVYNVIIYFIIVHIHNQLEQCCSK